MRERERKRKGGRDERTKIDSELEIEEGRERKKQRKGG
jgi:hypothetical protein